MLTITYQEKSNVYGQQCSYYTVNRNGRVVYACLHHSQAVEWIRKDQSK